MTASHEGTITVMPTRRCSLKCSDASCQCPCHLINAATVSVRYGNPSHADLHDLGISALMRRIATRLR
jgi:hypothetical protein